ncbi:MAG TPA: MFS transporter, partial [Vineibacter sp.]|nr:MFS transporter [Vineibacter sp.]
MSTQFDIEQPVLDAGGWRVLAPFKVREYRLLIAAVSLSIFAEGMWAVVMALQVIELDNDPASLSLVATCLGAGLVAFVLIGGLAADRIDQRAIIIAVETVNVIAVSAIAVLGLVGALQIWHMAVAAAILGIAAAFFFPAYSALLPRILPAAQLLAANGVEGVVRPVFQRAVGPAVAGIVVGATFPSLGAAVVATLFAVGLLLLVATKPAVKRPVDQPVRQHVLRDLRDGFLFMMRTPWLLWTL